MLSLAYGQDLLEGWTGRGSISTTFGSSYIGLFNTIPAEVDSAGSEVSTSGTAYARVQLSSSLFGTAPAKSTGTPTKVIITNTADIQFPQATASWSTINGFGWWAASSGGNWLIASTGVTWTPVTLGTGDIGRFAAGSLNLDI